MNLASQLTQEIEQHIKKNFNRICKIRLYERGRSVGDVSVSNTKSKSSILNFYLEQAGDFALIKKTATNSTKGYVVSEMPVEYKIKDLKQRFRRLDVFFDCDIMFLDGTRRYEGRDDDLHARKLRGEVE